MAKVKIEDVIVVADTMTPYTVQRSTENSRLYQSGIVTNDEQLNDVASKTALTVRMPFWNDLDGDSEGLSDTTALTPDKIGADEDAAVMNRRGKAWAANDLVKYFAGSDPIKAIYDGIADYWVREMQRNILIPSLNGIFGAGGALVATNQVDITAANGVAATDDNRINSDAIIDAAGLLGDRWESIVAMAMHSDVFRTLQKQKLIEFVSLSDQNVQVPFFIGREVIVDDGIKPISGANTPAAKYPVYLFGRGAIGLGNVALPSNEAFETDRDKLAGDDIIITRKHFLMHPRGVAFIGNYAGQTPSFADLATPANWKKVYSTKNIRIVRLLVNR